MKRAREKSAYRLLLVGKSGSGKRATGNSILGRPILGRCTFKSVTEDISVLDSMDYNMLVIDTPGVFDKKDTESHRAVQIQDSIKLLSPGPHAFLIVLNAASRVTDDGEKTFVFLRNMFGQQVFNHAIIILTHIDLVGNMKKLLHEIETHEAIKSLFSMCRRRIITINNIEHDMEVIQQQRDTLMLMIEELTENGMHYYHDERSVYADFQKMHVKESPDTFRDKRKIQRIFQEDQYQINMEQIKRQKEMINIHKKESEKARDEAQGETVTSPITFIHRALTSLASIGNTLNEAASSFVSWIAQPFQMS
ncbi:hypothetical protein ACJMK2_014592 [Sinanodonta woodiana]|uniref:AIG1-type G domain-containing protein n=1 Tax=Sinanodonta woodiana TaxID=1069815 RepID=A0ABD3V144_SINWO